MREKIVSVLGKKMKKDKVIEVNNTQTKMLIISSSNISLITSAADIDIESTLKEIAKSKSVTEIPELIKRYNILMAIRDTALSVDIDGMNACASLPILEEQKQLLISCLVKLKDNTRALSKTQDGEAYDASCSDIHNINMIIHQIQNLFIDVIEELEVNAIEV